MGYVTPPELGLHNPWGAASEASQSLSEDSSEDIFLQLLVAELANQNPLEPMTNSDFVNQTTQLSMLDELRSVNSNLTYMGLLDNSINSGMAVSFIGKEIKALGNSFELVDDQDPTLNFKLESDAAEVTIKIFDADGNQVRTTELGGLEKGDQEFVWDGKNDAGVDLEPGQYTFQIEAYDQDDQPVEATTYIIGIVTSVKFDDGNTILIVNGEEVSLSNIVEINLPEE